MGTIFGKAEHQHVPLAPVAPHSKEAPQSEHLLVVIMLQVNNSKTTKHYP